MKENERYQRESVTTQSCLTLCDPMDGSPTGSSVPGFSRQEYWNGFTSMPKALHLPTLSTVHLFHFCPSGGYEWYLIGFKIFRVSGNLLIVQAKFCVGVHVHCSRRARVFTRFLKTFVTEFSFWRIFVCLIHLKRMHTQRIEIWESIGSTLMRSIRIRMWGRLCNVSKTWKLQPK